MLNTLKVYEELNESLDSKSARKIAELMGRIYEDLLNTVTKTEFNELKEIVRDLSEAQKRTEIKVEELAEAQKRTEIKVEELVEAQKRTEETMKELAEAQKKSEAAIQFLTKSVKTIQKEVGGLSNTVGFHLEDLAYKALPALLLRDLNIEVKDRLKRKFYTFLDGREEELNIYGKGIRNTDRKEVYIIGEGKAHLGKKDIDVFLKRLKRLEQELKSEIVPLMISYSIRPEVEKLLHAHNMTYYFSYDFY